MWTAIQGTDEPFCDGLIEEGRPLFSIPLLFFVVLKTVGPIDEIGHLLRLMLHFLPSAP